MMQLEWGNYRHFPYERELGLREATAVLGNEVTVCADGQVSSNLVDLEAARKLTYFAAARTEDRLKRTLQSELEKSASLTGQRRQSTRYSVHGLHEYRGKFNPQVCGALINILGVTQNQKLLDPFCGSGTTLVEAAHRGITSTGADLNPLAVYIANAKLEAFRLEPDQLRLSLTRIVNTAEKSVVVADHDERLEYLAAWFEPVPLSQIEALRSAILNEEPSVRPFFSVVASNLLRDFSLQDPADLRIRRRPSANQTVHFAAAFYKNADDAIRRLEAAQQVIGPVAAAGRALLCDNRNLHEAVPGTLFDAAITSPPYATALPYIDTQRLSLVWLGLLHPKDIARVEGKLIGSREMKISERRATAEALMTNDAGLPEAEASFCLELQGALSADDGFRRQAVPTLLYRYFDLMQQTFVGVAKAMRPEARFALIVGHNHTQLSGRRFDIDTPTHLASLASHAGWEVQELTQLQPYQRYGLHSANAVKAETLLVLKKGKSPIRS